MRELLRHSTDDVCVCARGRCESTAQCAVQARCGGGFDGFCQGDERHRDDAMAVDARHGAARSLHFNSTDDAVELLVSPERDLPPTPHAQRKLRESSAYDARTIDFARSDSLPAAASACVVAA